MLTFWPSDAVLLAAQAGLVCGPQPRPPRIVLRLRTQAWAWLMPISLGGTIAVLAAAPGLATVYAWVAVIGIPILAIPPLACLPTGRRSEHAFGSIRSWVLAVIAAGALLAIAWSLHGHLVGQAAAVALTASSACTLASYLASLAPVSVLKVALVAMAVLDAFLVFGQLLEGPNRTLEAASPGAHLPHLQVAAFGAAVLGYGDLFVAAVLGNIIAADPHLRLSVRRWEAAALVLVCAAVFDLLFFAFDVLPATVPVAAAMVLVDRWSRRRSHRQLPFHTLSD